MGTVLRSFVIDRDGNPRRLARASFGALVEGVAPAAEWAATPFLCADVAVWCENRRPVRILGAVYHRYAVDARGRIAQSVQESAHLGLDIMGSRVMPAPPGAPRGLLGEAARRPPGPRALSLEAVLARAREVAGESHHFRVVQLPFSLAMPEALRARTEMVAGVPRSLLEAAAELGTTVISSAPLLQGQLARGLPRAWPPSPASLPKPSGPSRSPAPRPGSPPRSWEWPASPTCARTWPSWPCSPWPPRPWPDSCALAERG